MLVRRMTHVRFRNRKYTLVFTDHAKARMELREISEAEVITVIESGKLKPKTDKNRFWAYKRLKGRKDNLICASISIEAPKLIVVTTLVNWSPEK